MVTCRLKGRLGNLMLSIYTCFWYANKHGIPLTEVCFPRFYFHRVMGLDADIMSPSLDYLYQNREILFKVMGHFKEDSMYWSMVNEFGPEIIDTLDGNGTNVFLKFPTWHLPRSEKDVALFRELFPFDLDGVKQANGQYFSNDLPNIAFHVRRTDYAIHKKGMYLESLERVQERLNPLTGCNIVCFSDDPDWCQGNLVAPKDSRWTIKPANWSEPACNDMMLMACFDDINSTSHSTYSYCAKLLNRNVKEIPILDFHKG